MKVRAGKFEELISPLKPIFQKDNFSHADAREKPPLRSELFTLEQLDQHARKLAHAHTVTHESLPEQLLKRLSDNEDILFSTVALLQENIREKKSISPAADWLLDNFYLIEEEILIGKRYLPKGYSKGLPKLSNGKHKGFPRVYEIAIEIISHSDGHVDINSLSTFISAYQKVAFLTLGELWAIPIMIRLALLENLSRVAIQIALDRNDSALANTWANKIIEVTEKNPKDLVLVIADMARSNPPITSAFVGEFARKLQWKGSELSLPISWLEQHLSGTSDTLNSMILAENQKQAANQLSVSNSINSLRFIAKMEWREFVETMSAVEHVLRKDVGGIYAEMDFYTRDHYRHVVEKIAKESYLSEYEIAQNAINLAHESFEKNPGDKRRSHVGYYLIDKGRKLTEKRSRLKRPFIKAVVKQAEQSAPVLYIFSAIFITLALASVFIINAYGNNIRSFGLIGLGLLSLIGASQLAISLTNWWATLWVKPGLLPRLNFSHGIPVECRTMVVVPTLLADTRQIDTLVDDLEVRFLANRDENLVFTLLTDFRDAASETLPEDEHLIGHAVEKIKALNLRYGKAHNETFFLFHRPRTWNPVDKVWMGYERKRGKLSELNHLLRGKSRERFSIIIGDQRLFDTIKYVITLDTDTQLPRDAAWKLVGLMAHPMNQPVYNEKKNRVVEGFGIIQPRIAISLHGATRTGYSRLHENDSGIDPYTRVVSDVYQDVFGEGSFIGKGIYEIDTFERALNNRFPENRILSHDLLEGSYTRCAFASDVQFYEEYPSRYEADIMRRHRWIRGDWQIGNWFLPVAPDANRKLRRNSISALSRWKIFDNLRRSVIPIAQLLLLLAAWIILPNPVFWTLAILAILFAPPVISSLWSASQKPKEIAFKQHLNNTLGAAYKSLRQAMFTLVCLPYEAFMCADAIVRTLWRMYISKKKLLEWNPSHFAQRKKTSPLEAYASMWFAPLLAAGAGLYLFDSYGLTLRLFIALPFLALWAASPFIVWMVNRPVVTKRSALNNNQKLYLRELSRKTWSFFEVFVSETDNWLPPDNLQQYPIPVIAHRTSPTNIGLALLANLSAYDFGYITASALIDRTRKTFSTLAKLERQGGHFFNWYDTQSLRVLHPRYISTVDSGNLTGHLLTLRQGLLTLPNEPVVHAKLFTGIIDTLAILKKLLREHQGGFEQLEKMLESVTASNSVFDFHHQLQQAASHFKAIQSSFNADVNSETGWWINACNEQLEHAQHQLTAFAPWASHDTPEDVQKIDYLTRIPTLAGLAQLPVILNTDLVAARHSPEVQAWLEQIRPAISEAGNRAARSIEAIHELAQAAYAFADVRYDFLYDKVQRLLAIGFNADDNRLDASFYDLLASEARLASFVAIAQGKLPQESWFALGRRLTSAGKTPVLISWSGSMFEYLMPMLVMPNYENTLLDEMAVGMVKKQIEYGQQHNVPWGISESCYNVVDSNLTYQYRAFGVPGLGFKRGLGQDLVIAPYATVMALMVDPQAAYDNLQTMKAKGFEGRYGFFEAVDYTPSRLSRGQSHAVIQTFMAHHQGMGLLSLAYLLLNQPMQKRFEADPQFQTALLLLQEQVPKTIGFYSGSSEEKNPSPASTVSDIRVITTPHTPVPEVQLLSNGKYHVMVTNAGGGYSRWHDLALTRWREDTTADNWGTFCYVRDLESGKLWSNAFQPTLKPADHYEAIFSQAKVEFRRRDSEIETYTEIIVSPEDDVEVRRIHFINHSKRKRRISVTTYCEVVIAMPASDNAHPAFSNLFVQTEIHEPQSAIVCSRRARSKEEHPPWMFHLVKVSGTKPVSVSYETNRSLFIGRGQSVVNPAALQGDQPLSGSNGSVLDPIAAVQHQLVLEPGATITVDVVTGIAPTREVNRMLVDKYQDKHLRDRAFELSWTHSQVVLRQIGATESDAELYGRLAGSILYANPALRAPANVVLKNQRGQSALWAYSISGDLPIVLLRTSDSENIALAKQMVKAQAYWNLKGLAVDLVIINEDPGGYRQVLQDQIQGLIAGGTTITASEKPGRIFVRPVDQIPAEDLILLQTVARAIISDTRGSLAEQVQKKKTAKPAIPKFDVLPAEESVIEVDAPDTSLHFFNGIGGFSNDGREYVIHSGGKKQTPLPWVNILANPTFGTLISERGSSYTWFENAYEFRLSPWHNDPVIDGSGEAFYLRDEETGTFWSPMPYPVNNGTYTTRHGFGYTSFEHHEEGIHSTVTVYVDIEAAIKFITIKTRNTSGRSRKLSATGYVEWVLGSQRPKSSFHVITELESNTGALMARNPYNSEFTNRVTFLDVDDTKFEYTADRTEFLGRHGTMRHPDAMTRVHLSGKTGACLDPCAALRVAFELDHDREHTVTFRLGTAKDMLEAIALIKKFEGSQAATTAFENVNTFWRKSLRAIEVETPDQAINFLVNGWLEYQILSSRLWGRTGFYQSGGAFGFRDQLQDVLALMHSQPGLTRKQLVLCASRQFKEGDVQHWWHPPIGRGVRTMCSDDYLWLPYVASRYVNTTHDTGVLDEVIPFLQGRLLNVGEESYYDLPVVSDQQATLYEHCKAAIRMGLKTGTHGLPLIGSGDWNDGMNLVGIHGRGESVWLAFFLYDILNRFQKIAVIRNDHEFAQLCTKEAETLKENISRHAWDGEWYMRAYFDDGSPLGSHLNRECMIDAIAQSWSVISGAGEPERVKIAMQSANQHLINREKGLIQLLEPPFDTADMDPGYIKGYVPGVRENGGQYTHAAIWMVMAFAELNERERVYELLSLINPINHGKTPEDVSVYKAEPYVMAADVYGVSPHTGRGGWTWYTGSAGWMYQLITESFLGIKRVGNTLELHPRIPAAWKSVKITYTLFQNSYPIEVIQNETGFTVKVNGREISGNTIVLDDHTPVKQTT